MADFLDRLDQKGIRETRPERQEGRSPAGERGGNYLNGFQGVRTENGSSRGRPGGEDVGRPEPITTHLKRTIYPCFKKDDFPGKLNSQTVVFRGPYMGTSRMYRTGVPRS